MVPPATTPPPRKRASVTVSEPTSRQVSSKRLRTTATSHVNNTGQVAISSKSAGPTVSSKSAGPTASPIHSNDPLLIAPQKPKPIVDSTVPAYQPNRQTLFLAEDLYTILWKPVQSSQKYSVNVSKHIHSYGNDIHSYFVSEASGRNAAALNGPISVYRHVGHVVLHNFRQNQSLPEHEKWLPTISNSTADYINMRALISRAWSNNGALLESLISLADPEPNPWPAPLIVLLANREEVTAAAATANGIRNINSHLSVQVYIGRLLFELISCVHIRVLFTSLRPSAPYTPIAEMPSHTSTFNQSSISGHGPSGNSFAKLLRDSESRGYADLTTETRTKIHNTLTVRLYHYQEQTVRWMLDKENSPHVLSNYFWEERSFTDSPHCKDSKFYYFPLTGEVRLFKPPSMRGGMVAEEIGLGKTAEALALIAAQKSEHNPVEIDVMCERRPTHISVKDGIAHLSRQRTRNLERSPKPCSDFHHGDEIIDKRETFDFPANVRIRRWPAKTTLVVCPKSLVSQWKREVSKLAPSLSLEVWSPKTKKGESSPLSVAVGENAKDIVLATYDMIRNDSTLSKISWRRLILDESHVTRRSAAQVANDVLNLRCDTRFLMTGTPLVNSINDLRGQLAFLKIWPFCLEQDGFWDTFVNYPFRCGCPTPVLRKLLNVTMIRHSKAQQLNVLLPPRSYETIRVSLGGSYRACYYFVLAICMEEVESQTAQLPNTRRLRTLLKSLLMLCLSPYLLDVEPLDLVRRITWCRRRGVAAASQIIQKVSAQEAIQFMAETSPGPATETVWGTAMRSGALATGVDPFMRLPISELQELVVSRKLLTRVRALRTPRERLAAIAAGGVHKLESDSLAELRRTAIRLELGSVDEVSAWSRDRASSQLKLYYDMESAKQTVQSVPESGLSAIMRLIERRENPNCPVCLTDCEGRIAATKCGHLYCHECMTMLLGPGTGSAGRCAICRRDLTPDMAVEILRDEPVIESERIEEESSNDNIASLLNERVSTADMSSRIDSDAPNDVVEAGRAPEENVIQEYSTARDVWREFESISPDVRDFNSIGRDKRFPFLSPEFLRHLLVARRTQAASPKLLALRMLIQSSGPNVKFCVVAGSVHSLREIANFLNTEGIVCVGACTASDYSAANSHDLKTAAERFSADPDVRVYLLNPGNATGLTLTAASVVVFMETLMRAVDEFQAVSRVHRIGQTRPVKIIRIVAKNTLEEKIAGSRIEVTNEVEESQTLLATPNNDTSDSFILRLFRR